MRYVGCALIMLAAALVSSWYRASMASRLAALAALLSLSRHIFSRVSEYMEPPSVWSVGFLTGCPEVDALVEMIASGMTPAEAYGRGRLRALLSPSAREAADGLFNSPPRGEIGAERRVLGEITERIAAIYESERTEAGERCRVFAVMALMLSSGAVILIV